MPRGLVALIFVLLIVIIIFMAFQINDNSTKCVQLRTSQQDKVAKAAKLLIQSVTQSHPLFCLDNAVEAKILVDDVTSELGGVAAAERILKLPKGRLQSLRDQVYKNHESIQDNVMQKVIKQYPDLDIEENETARISKKKRSRHH